MGSLRHYLYLEQLGAIPAALHIKCILHKVEISPGFKMTFLLFLIKVLG